MGRALVDSLPPPSSPPNFRPVYFRRRFLERAAAAATALLVVALGSYLVLRQRDARGATLFEADAAKSEKANEKVIEDPATLEPLAFQPPSPVLDDVFGTRVMKYSIALDRVRRDGVSPELGATEEALGREDVRTALGDDVFGELQNVKRVARETAKAPPNDEASVTALDMAVAKLDNALLRNRQPYFVDVSVLASTSKKTHTTTRMLLFYEFSIADSGLFASGKDRVRSVRVRRLDRLNWSHTSLGFVNPHRAQATVLLDQVDEQLVRHLVPALASGASMPLVRESDRKGTVTPLSPPLMAMSMRAGEHAREELAHLPNVNADIVRELGDDLLARRELFEKWNAAREVGGVGLRVPSNLAFDVDSVVATGLADPEDIASLRQIQARLARPEVDATYRALRDAFADSIERHEVEHRLDILQSITMPKEVLPFIRGEGRVANDMREAVMNELSAYVSQIARDDRMPKTTLALLQRFLVNPRTRGSTEAFVAIIATEAIARELHIEDIAPLVSRGVLDEDRLSRAHEKITAASGERLSQAAAAAYKRLFGRDLAPLSRIADADPKGEAPGTTL